MSRGSIGREDLIQSCDQNLKNGRNILLTGPAGIGKSTILHDIGQLAQSRREVWLAGSGVPVGDEISGSLLIELSRRLPEGILNSLSATTRDVVVSTPTDDPQSLISAWTTVLRQCSASAPVLLTIDAVVHADVFSLEVLGAALRATRDVPVRVLLADRRIPPNIVRMVPHPINHFEVPPLSADAVASFLEQYGLPAKLFGSLHIDSAGNPSLLVALAGAMSYQHAATVSTETISPVVAALIHDRLDGLDEEATATLRMAAHAANPTLTLLRRAGRTNAAEEISRAAACGLVAQHDDIVWFTPALAAKVVLAGVTSSERTAFHDKLAEAVSTREESLRHRALADPTPNAQFAQELADAGYLCRDRGASALAAELLVLAADRSEVSANQPHADWLADAANLAAATGDEILARSSSARALSESTSAKQRVLARLSAVRLAGHNTASIQQELTTAQQDADADPESLLSVLLWRTWTNLLAGDLEGALVSGQEAAQHARAAGNDSSAAMGLAAAASAARAIGNSQYTQLMDEALAIGVTPEPGHINLSAEYFAARFMLLDDRLQEAATVLGKLLSFAQRGGPVERVSILRSLLETNLRMGRCAQAISTAQQITGDAARNGLSPGPSWYSASLAELAAGSLTRAAAYATQGIRACEQDQDIVYVRLNLHSAGQALLRSGRPHDAVEALRNLAEVDHRYGYKDPTNVRYHSDLVAALVATDDPESARTVLNECREQLTAFPENRSVPAALDRSTALLLSHANKFDEADELLDAAAATFATLSMPIDQGHTLLVQGQLARQRRRHAAARTHVQRAERLFADASANSWLNQCSTFRTHLDGASERPTGVAAQSPLSQLTEAEQRIARLVAQGATNKEIAQRLYLSVKTVEATLTRVYRKVGVRSRTQLGVHLGLTGD